MKKTAIFLFVLLLLFSLCVEKDATSEKTVQSANTFSSIPLSDMQIEACKSANDGGTCRTKLPEIEIVLTEDCCKYLNKCC
jgi:hypothetical protein